MQTLDSLYDGQNAVICQVRLEGELYRRISELGITKGTEIKKVITSSFGDPCVYCVRGCRLALRKSETSKIFIQ